MADRNGPNDDNVFTGVPSTPQDLYAVMMFLLALYLVGDWVCRRLLKIVPPLVGYILVGIVVGPEGFDLLSSNTNGAAIVETFVVLGNLGLVLLITQAGLEMDYDTLRLVGLRGVAIAVAGTILPVSIGTAIAFRFLNDWKSALSAGCSFGPTSAGIAMNVLGRCRISSTSSVTSRNEPGSDDNKTDADRNILQLPVGQLIVAAAIVDDILALVVLSQLQALTTTTSFENDGNGNLANTNTSLALDIALPIVSALLWLVVGGAIALWIFPKFLAWMLDRIASVFPSIQDTNKSGSVSLAILVGLLYLLFPATYFSRASYLLGTFLSGLAFCRDDTGVDELFRSQFKRPMDWLMKLFFSASIGFQVPVRAFGDPVIVLRGFLFALALLGKLAVGLLTPDFHSRRGGLYGDASPRNDVTSDQGATKRFNSKHVRDCFVVGFSMMGEAEFAFVVAVFGVSEGLVPPDIYASIVWAILLSTIMSPLLLKTTLALFPYERNVQDAGVADVDVEGEDDASSKGETIVVKNL